MTAVTRILVLISFLLMTSCINQNIVVDPVSMKGNGLLVGHVSASDFGLGHFFSNGDIRLGDGSENLYKGAYKNGFITVPLAPGKYKISSLDVRYGNRIQWLPIKGEFTIKAGEVTNLGEVFLLFSKKRNGRYNFFYLDNNDDMQAFLRTEYSEVYKGLKKKKFNKANVKYIKKKYINKLRQQAIAQVNKNKFNRYVTTGPLGSIGVYKRDKKGKVKSIKWIDTGTYLGPESCHLSKRKAYCIVPHRTKGDRVFAADGSRYKFYKKPADFQKGKFKLLKDKSLLWINDDFSYFRSYDKAKSWIAEKTHKKTIKLGFLDYYTPSMTPRVYEARRGFYIYATRDGSPLLFNKYKSNKSSKLATPDGDNGIGYIAETSAGIYTVPSYKTLFVDSKVYFKANGKNEWVQRAVKEDGCGEIKTENYKKDIVVLDCGQDGNYFSSNKGAMWKKKI